jgi:uncharacterized protein (TIGR01777 family)
MTHKRAVIAGGSGFLGTALATALKEAGWEPVILSRHPLDDTPFREVGWDARSPGDWVRELEGAAAIVNLAGHRIDCVHSAANKRAILQSRINSVAAIAAALRECPNPPAVWVQASAVGYYGTAGSGRREEDAPAGDDFLSDVCRQWEAAFSNGCPATVRSVTLRLGMVLDADDGALPVLARLARLFLGGTAGSGTQGMSWIHLADAMAAFRRAIEDSAVQGTYNTCAPEPVSNTEFMRALRTALHRPWCPPAPALAVTAIARLFLKVDPSLVLRGQYAVPARLLRAGFAFQYSRIDRALADLLSGGQSRQ